jgi:cell division septal protein FtsQ
MGKRIKVEDQRFMRRRGNLRVRRERLRKGFGRYRGRLMIAVVVLITGATATVQARALLTGSELFRVRQIAFQGRRQAPIEAMHERLRPALSQNIFTVDLDALRHDLMDDPWIESARVRRKLPDTLHVTLRERTPVAVAAAAGGMHLVGADGVVIQPYDPDALPGHFPALAGIPAAAGEERDRAIRRGIRLILALGERYPNLLDQIDRIDIGRADANDVHLRDSGMLLRLPPHGGLGTLPSWVRIREQIEQQYPRPARLDLRWKDQIAITTPDGRNSSG